jgi:hypothetical protein
MLGATAVSGRLVETDRVAEHDDGGPGVASASPSRGKEQGRAFIIAPVGVPEPSRINDFNRCRAVRFNRAIRRALRRSTPLGQTSNRELQGGGPLTAPSQHSEKPAYFPWLPLRARRPESRTMDARDKKLPVFRSGRRYVVELCNTVRPHLSLGYRPPAPQTMNPFLIPLDQAAQMQ